MSAQFQEGNTQVPISKDNNIFFNKKNKNLNLQVVVNCVSKNIPYINSNSDHLLHFRIVSPTA